MAKYTLITGASEGLGVEFARLAAAERRPLILTARSEDKLHALADELRDKAGDIVVIPADLSKPDEAERLWSEASAGREIDVLVNNAGLGQHGDFADPDGWDRELNSINVNLVALTALMKRAIPHMKTQGGGRILNVASVAGMLPGPNMAVYHATKAYVISLSEGVTEELRGTGVTVTSLCPGATSTNFFTDADMHDIRLLKMGKPATAASVARFGWDKMLAGKRVVIPGAMNVIFSLMARFFPRSVVTRVGNIIMGKA